MRMRAAFGRRGVLILGIVASLAIVATLGHARGTPGFEAGSPTELITVEQCQAKWEEELRRSTRIQIAVTIAVGLAGTISGILGHKRWQKSHPPSAEATG